MRRPSITGWLRRMEIRHWAIHGMSTECFPSVSFFLLFFFGLLLVSEMPHVRVWIVLHLHLVRFSSPLATAQGPVQGLKCTYLGAQPGYVIYYCLGLGFLCAPGRVCGPAKMQASQARPPAGTHSSRMSTCIPLRIRLVSDDRLAQQMIGHPKVIPRAH